MNHNRYLCKAKRKDWENLPKDKQWVYGYYVSGFDNTLRRPIHSIVDPNKVYGINTTGAFHEIDETTLCQCTGLTDKCGNLIWEKDIVKWKQSEGKG